MLERFLDRTRIVAAIRRTLGDRGFVEVEGPTLHAIAGGAAARPFKTHHNTLDIDLFLRIALELHLKRLLVGGIERVYELGRVYRNEGHQPAAQSRIHDARGLPGLRRLPLDDGPDRGVHLRGDSGDRGTDRSRRTINCRGASGRSTSRRRSPARPTPSCSPSTPASTPTDEAGVAKLAKSLGIETAGRHPDVIKNDVFEEKVEGQLDGPDLRASTTRRASARSPSGSGTTRASPSGSSCSSRGMEIANAYTELNDPDLQEQLFKSQLAGLSDEDSMAKMDHDFIRALRHGMPPAGGLGIGIDRLVMLLTNTPIDPRRDSVPAAATGENSGRAGDTTRSHLRQGWRPMYKLLLCWRYLRTRYIALVCIVSVTLGVATMIVVNSVMAGFTHEMQHRLNGMLGDLVVQSPQHGRRARRRRPHGADSRARRATRSSACRPRCACRR